MHWPDQDSALMNHYSQSKVKTKYNHPTAQMPKEVSIVPKHPLFTREGGSFE